MSPCVVKKLPRNRLVRSALLAGLLVLFILWVIGQFTRDATLLSALCFYVPSLFLACSLSACATWAYLEKHVRQGFLATVLAIPPFIWVGFVENSFFRPTHTRATAIEVQRAVHWNVYDGFLGWKAIADIASSLEADIYVFSEIPYAHANLFARQLGDDYDAIEFDTMAVVARGTIEDTRWLVRRRGAQFFRLNWRQHEKVTSVFVVDLLSDPSIPRNPPLRQLRALIEEEQPDLVIGDFNAPRRSLVLDNLPHGYEHAYRSVGSGFGYTWPVPCPMYSLDHCIHGPQITPLAYELHSTFRSDHRLQVFDFTYR